MKERNPGLDLLISTDVLSEGQNLQDCGVVVNYDLHWNPTRMVQRAGRIDRIGSDFSTISIYNMFPDAGLERLLRLVESLSRKIAYIDETGFLDASILGEAVHPRNFNTLRRIRDEDNKVVAEQEQFVELASSEYLLQQLKSLLATGAQERLDALPDGIHSGLNRPSYGKTVRVRQPSSTWAAPLWKFLMKPRPKRLTKSKRNSVSAGWSGLRCKCQICRQL